jgi:ADP-heptose:LPS heptosyltransferase
MTTSILIVLSGSLGDIARALCLPAHLKTHFPESGLAWLVEERWADLIAGHPHIDRTVTFRRAWRVEAVTDVIAQLKRESYDISLDLQRIFKSGLLSLASGATRRIGFHPRNSKEMNWIFNNEHIGYQSENTSKLQHYLKFCEYLGLSPPERLDFGMRPQLPGAFRNQAFSSPYISVVMGSSWPSKNWHLEGYAELITKVLSAGRYDVLLLGVRDQAKTAEMLEKRLQSASVVNLVDRTSIRELLYILSKAEAAVGPDTGSGHLAAAVGTPYVTMVGPTTPERIAPYGCEHLTVRSSPCAPCVKRACARPQYDCMGSISANAVFDKLEVALGQRAVMESNRGIQGLRNWM